MSSPKNTKNHAQILSGDDRDDRDDIIPVSDDEPPLPLPTPSHMSSTRTQTHSHKVKVEGLDSPAIPCLFQPCDYKHEIEFDLSLHYLEKHKPEALQVTNR